MEASATNLEGAIGQTLNNIQKMLKEDPSGESKIKKLVNNIKEIGKNDLKAQVILKQQLDNVVAVMEEYLETEPSFNASKIMCFFGGLSSKGRLRDTEKPKVKKALEHVADKVKYLKEKMKELMAGESQQDFELVGREKEKEEIIDQLILLSRKNKTCPVPVIAITGLAGIGKTKLVHSVYEDQNLQRQVGFPARVNGSNHNAAFDAASIAKEAIEAVMKPESEKPSPKTETFNMIVILDDWRVEIGDEHLKELQEKVKEGWRVKIEGMDLKDLKAIKEILKNDPSVDVGEELDEKVLQDKLKEVRVAAILITTPNSLVVKNIAASPVKSYALSGLDEKTSMSLFQTTILGRGEEEGADYSLFLSTITEDVRRKIVGQCRGVPLAIVIMANLLRSSRSLSTELTEEFLQLLWYLYFHNEDSLRLLFCFGYCSMFPQSYLIDAERLIHLWMAEGFIKSEEDGLERLRVLIGRSIFQDVKEDEFEQVRSFRMHPLMHDIATFLIDTLDMELDKVPEKLVRASFDLSSDFSRGIPATMVDKAKEIKSMFFFAKTQSRVSLQREMSAPILECILKNSFKRLCVLDLRSLQIVTVPGSIGELNNLEYLDLSLNDIEKLPNSITKLSKLQTLKLSRCYSLKELPKNFENLTKLAHLDVEGCLGLTHMPRNMSKMSSLQTLPAFVANKNDSMGGLEEIENLTHLRGHLEILHLERVQSPLEKLSLLRKKEHLKSLTLRWDIDLAVDEEKGKTHLTLLNSLEPHADLKVLILVGYQGPTFSTWINQFKSLVKLSLQDCHGCIYLSQQDQLPNLRILELLRFDKLEYIVAQTSDDKGTDDHFYQNLKELIIFDCPKLRSWWEKEKEVKDRPVFASISKLHVHHCPKLTCMPLYPRLNMVPEGSTSFGKDMFLEDSSLQLLLDTKSTSTCGEGFSIIPLESLHILNCNHLENISNGFLHLGSLQSLRIENCAGINLEGNQWEGLKSLRFLTLREIPNLKSLSFGDSVTSLRELSLQNCHGLISISNSIGKLTSLRELTLQNCHGLTSISDSIGKVTSLVRLVISKCNKLESLPKTMKDLKSLRTLIISDCALLLPRIQPETGDDWPQISRIKDLQVN